MSAYDVNFPSYTLSSEGWWKIYDAREFLAGGFTWTGFVPVAGNEITFRVEGPGRLIGLGNGDPGCHEPDKPASFTDGKRSAFNGLCLAFVQALKQAGSIHVEASSAGLESSSVAIAANAAKLRPAI